MKMKMVCLESISGWLLEPGGTCCVDFVAVDFKHLLPT